MSLPASANELLANLDSNGAGRSERAASRELSNHLFAFIAAHLTKNPKQPLGRASKLSKMSQIVRRLTLELTNSLVVRCSPVRRSLARWLTRSWLNLKFPLILAAAAASRSSLILSVRSFARSHSKDELKPINERKTRMDGNANLLLLLLLRLLSLHSSKVTKVKQPSLVGKLRRISSTFAKGKRSRETMEQFLFFIFSCHSAHLAGWRRARQVSCQVSQVGQQVQKMTD